MKQCESEGDSGLILIENIHLRQLQVRYYLLFCAINSQLKHNEGALTAATKGNSLLKTNSSHLHRFALKSRIEVDRKVMVLLSELANL